MRARVFSRFQERWVNVTRISACFLGETYDPEKQVTAFEEVVRLLRVPAESVAAGGDHVIQGMAHYVLSPHSVSEGLRIFRLIPLPDQVLWKIQSAKVTDPVTGLLVDIGTTFLSNIWARKITRGFSGEMKGGFEREVIRYVCGATVQAGDLLDGRKIQRVYTEQGVLTAET
jgi:hypothetical protein